MKLSSKSLVRKLDTLWSKIIRTRDCPGGFGKCITCGRIKPYSEMDCGHYVGREHWATRWNEKNCHAQCRYCNRMQEGNKGIYAREIDKRYGAGTAEMLESWRAKSKRPKDFEMEINYDLMKTNHPERTT